MSWIQEFHTEDEDGQPEIWKVFYKRLSGLDVIRLDEILAEELNNIEKTAKIAELVIRRIHINEHIASLPMLEHPYDMIDKVVSSHLTFRRHNEPQSEPPA